MRAVAARVLEVKCLDPRTTADYYLPPNKVAQSASEIHFQWPGHLPDLYSSDCHYVRACLFGAISEILCLLGEIHR